MTEETVENIANSMPHDHTIPIIVSDDSVARVNVLTDEQELEPYKKQYIKEKRKSVTFNGFRKGTAPLEMVARFFKEEARQSARDNVLYMKYMKLLQEHKLQPLSQPKLNHIHDKDGLITAELTVDVLQPVVLGQYLGLDVEKMPLKSVDDGIKKTLLEIKQSYPKLVDATNTVVENGNVVIADFTVTNGDKELEKQVDFKISLGNNFYYQAFEEQLVGMNVGQDKEFDIHFPEAYHKEDFKGKIMHFNVKVKAIKCIAQYPNDELAKVLGHENEDKMIELLTKEIEAKYKDDEHLFYENQILGQLLSAHQFKIPRKLIDAEIAKIRAEQPDMPVDKVEEIADRFVRTDLILNAIYERHPEIQFNQQQFNDKIAELAAKANDTVENTIQKLQTSGKLQTYINYLSNCKVIDFIIEMSEKTSKVEENKEEKENE